MCGCVSFLQSVVGITGTGLKGGDLYKKVDCVFLFNT